MGLYRRKNKNGSLSPVWWMCFTADGQSYNRSTQTTDYKRAQAVEAKVRVLVHEEKWFDVNETKKHTFDEMMDRFMREHAPTVAEKTQKSYKNSLVHLREFFSGSTLHKIDSDLVMQYVVHRREQTCELHSETCLKCKHKPETEECKALREKRKCRPATRNRELAMLSKAVNQARLWKWTKENPCELVKRENEGNDHVGQCLPDDKEEELLDICRSLCNGQLIEMVIVAMNTGVRENEMLGMKWDNVDFRARTVTVIQKGNKEKVCPMNDTVYNLLLTKSKVRSMSGYVFVTGNGTPYIARNMYREFKKACIRVGLLTFRFHDLRHTVGTRLARAGHDIYAIASVLGHSQLATAKRYAKHNVQSLQNVVKSLVKKETVVNG